MRVYDRIHLYNVHSIYLLNMMNYLYKVYTYTYDASQLGLHNMMHHDNIQRSLASLSLFDVGYIMDSAILINGLLEIMSKESTPALKDIAQRTVRDVGVKNAGTPIILTVRMLLLLSPSGENTHIYIHIGDSSHGFTRYVSKYSIE